MAKVLFKIDMPPDAVMDRLFATVPIMQSYKVTDKAVRAAAKPIVARAKENAPRSSLTGSTKKRSRSQAQKAGWTIPLWRTVGATVKRYERASFAAVGPAWPQGNKVFFNSAHLKGGRREVYWGKATGRVVQQVDNWIKRSGDETQGAQRAAMLESIRKSIREMLP